MTYNLLSELRGEIHSGCFGRIRVTQLALAEALSATACGGSCALSELGVPAPFELR